MLRAPTTTIEALKHFAASHERSASAEARLALECHIFSCMIDAIDHDLDFVETIRRERPEVDLAELRREAEADLEAARERVFARPSQALERLAEVVRA